MIILIPTYNRPKKLERTLKFYQETNVNVKHHIRVLDGSDISNLSINKNNCKKYEVAHVSKPSVGYFERLKEEFFSIDDEKIVCLCPDEDVFLYDYLVEAELFLNKNPDYTIHIGRYISYSKPILKLHRVNFSRDTISDLNIDCEDPNLRSHLFLTSLMAGCSPIFWGVRKCKYFKETLKFQSKMSLGSASECSDQILMCYLGKLMFSKTPMLIRDETKVKQKIKSDQRDNDNYIKRGDAEIAISEFNQCFGNSCSDIAKQFFSLYDRKYSNNEGTNIALQILKRPALYFKAYWGTAYEKKYLRYCNLISKIFLVFHEVIWALIINTQLKKRFGTKVIKNILKITSDS